jgi:class 3 adenylate cyclase
MSGTMGDRVRAAQVIQAVAGPAHAIVGYQELLVEDVRKEGPADALPDLQRVLDAANGLAALVDRALTAAMEGAAMDGAAKAALRHDLRTPINGIVGYLEMVAEDFGDALTDRMAADADRILAAARDLLGIIDAIVDNAAPATLDADPSITAALTRAVAAQSSATAPDRARVLVIDDVEANRDLLARRLFRDGHVVEAVASASEALAMLRRGRFDIALVDVIMPDMNGIELLQNLKSSDAWRDMSVIMVSGLDDNDAVVRCIALGAEDYLPKPVDAVLLRARLSACLERRRWREQEQRYLAQIEFEKQRADALLDAILPGQVVKRLVGGETVIVDRFESATIVFADIVGFTAMSASIKPGEVLRYLDGLFTAFDDIADRCGVEKIKTIGDAYMAAAGLPQARDDHAAVAVEFAHALQREMRSLRGDAPGLSLRIGIHSGSVIAGLIGRKRFVYDVWGHAVNLASRLEGHCEPGRILASVDVLRALGARVDRSDVFQIDIRGIGSVSALHLD